MTFLYTKEKSYAVYFIKIIINFVLLTQDFSRRLDIELSKNYIVSNKYFEKRFSQT